MLTYCDSTRLNKHFGDFGGNNDMSDFETGRLNPDIDGITKIIESDQFEETFRNILPLVCDGFSISSYDLDGGRKLYTAPALGRRYALAARLAHAKCMGKTSAVLGSGDRTIVQLAAAACKEIDLKLSITLSKALAQDAAFVAALRDLGAEVDDKTCVELFDQPYAYVEVPFTSDPVDYIIQVDANYGVWPKPALTGVFAGLYGADLLEKLGKAPEACVVPIQDGTEAVGVFKALKNTACKLATCEDAVAQEFHLIDTGAYTLATRSAVEDIPNTSICPELADMWHKAQVCRLGCDRLYAVDTSALDATGLPAAAKRAAALAFEALDCKELLVLEV